MEYLNPEKEHELLEDFNKRFPYKVELHVHLDGAVRPQTIIDVAKERGMLDDLPHKNVEELNRDVILTEPCNLTRLLQSFDYFIPILRGYKPAVNRIAYEFCEDCYRHKIRYVEVRYCPTLLATDDLTARDVVLAVNEGLQQGMKKFDITVKTILCCMTHEKEKAQIILELCKEFKDAGVVAIDNAGEEFEPGTPHEHCPLKQVFREAAEHGIHRTVHAGESGTFEAVQEALDDMLAERIGHGYHCVDDPDLYRRVLKDQVHLETCPISSILTKACSSDIQQHPLKKFVRDGASYSINTDDPVVLGNSITDDYKHAQDMGLSDKDIIRGIFHAARACFASDEEKKKLLADLEEVYGQQP